MVRSSLQAPPAPLFLPDSCPRVNRPRAQDPETCFAFDSGLASALPTVLRFFACCQWWRRLRRLRKRVEIPRGRAAV